MRGVILTPLFFRDIVNVNGGKKMEALQMESLMGSPLAGSLITSHECVYPATTTSYVADRFFHAKHNLMQ